MIDYLSEMRVQVRSISGVWDIQDSYSNFKGLEIVVFKGEQRGLCFYSILNKGKSRKKGWKDNQKPQLKRILWAIIKFFFLMHFVLLQPWQGFEHGAVIIRFTF